MSDGTPTPIFCDKCRRCIGHEWEKEREAGGVFCSACLREVAQERYAEIARLKADAAVLVGALEAIISVSPDEDMDYTMALDHDAEAMAKIAHTALSSAPESAKKLRAVVEAAKRVAAHLGGNESMLNSLLTAQRRAVLDTIEAVSAL
jgi:hypothetical protein